MPAPASDRKGVEDGRPAEGRLRPRTSDQRTPAFRMSDDSAPTVFLPSFGDKQKNQLTFAVLLDPDAPFGLEEFLF